MSVLIFRVNLSLHIAKNTKRYNGATSMGGNAVRLCRPQMLKRWGVDELALELLRKFSYFCKFLTKLFVYCFVKCSLNFAKSVRNVKLKF